MESKIIKSGDKNFEQEKTKIFEPKQLTKEEQLKLIFKDTLEDWCYWVDDSGKIIESKLNERVSVLLKEVKIRTKL